MNLQNRCCQKVAYSLRILHADGSIELNAYLQPTYYYHLKDHASATLSTGLGNVLAVVSPTVTNSLEVLQTNDYFPFGMSMSKNSTTTPYNKYKYNGKEEQEMPGKWLDYGARFYDAQLGRWHSVDPLAQSYDNTSSYAYVLNNPINAIDPDGQLIIFVNGFMLDQWKGQDNNKTILFSYGYGGMHGEIPNANYHPYPPQRNFTIKSAEYMGKPFNYWGNEQNPNAGVGGVFSQVYNDYNTLFVNATADNNSQAQDRYSEGINAGYDLISKLIGCITLNEGETIKIIGHSQGAAFAAGLAFVLANNQKYSSLVEIVHYIAPPQPGDFKHPSNIHGEQWSTVSDWVSSKWTPLMWLNGGSSLKKIDGILSNHYHIRESYQGSRGGHSANTYLDRLVEYYRSLGIDVTVYE
jgi:RHS repeat-associated protein